MHVSFSNAVGGLAHLPPVEAAEPGLGVAYVFCTHVGSGDGEGVAEIGIAVGTGVADGYAEARMSGEYVVGGDVHVDGTSV